MDLEKLLLKLRSISGVDGADIDAIADFVKGKNEELNRSQVQLIELKKAQKSATQLQKILDKADTEGYDKPALKVFIDSNILPLDQLKFNESGKLALGDRDLSEIIESTPYLKRALILATQETATPDANSSHNETTPSPAGNSSTPAATPEMGTTTSAPNSTKPLDNLISSGLFATP